MIYPSGYTSAGQINPQNLPKAKYNEDGNLVITLPEEIK